MALDNQTTQEINNIIISQLESSLGQTIPILPKAFIRVLSKVLGGVFVILYKYGGWMFLQIFVKTASINETVINGITVAPLIAWGRLIGVGDPVKATNAELEIQITVENQVGTLQSNSQLVNSDNGVTYITIGDVLLNAPTVTATIKAVSDQSDGGGAGSIGNLEIGDTVTFANPLPNVSRDTVVTSQLVTASDAETPDEYRQRVIDRFQKRPQGGAYADYEIWGEEPVGIINVYPYTGSPGIVNVYAEATPESSGDPDGYPTTAQLQEVSDSIEFDLNGLASRRPANSFVNVLSITRVQFNIEIFGLNVDDEATVKSNIQAGLEEYFLNAEPYIPGLSILPRKDIITSAGVASVIIDIVSSAGGVFSSVQITKDGDTIPSTIYALDEGEKAKVGTITYA